MGIIFITILALFTSACGIKVSSDPVKVERVTVDHNININLQNVALYYRGVCELELTQPPPAPPPTEEEIQACVDKRVIDFNNAYNFGGI